MTEKPHTGRWPKGKSGNPRGRKPGMGEVARLRQAITKDVPSILKAMVRRALDGDAGAARLLLERVVPALKPAEQAVPLALLPADGLTAQGQSIIGALALGEIAPGQAAALLAALAAMARVKELDDFEARLRRLEGDIDADQP